MMKKYIALVLLILLVATSILYLIPNFRFNYNNKIYTFTNFPSPLNKAYENIKGNIPGVNDTYVIVIESETAASNDKEWSGLASRDQIIIEQRLETLLGNDFEVRLDNLDRKAKFTVKSTDKIFNTDLLTAKNDLFEISSVSSVSSASTNDQTEQQKTVVDLKRDDFGYAEVVKEQNQQGQTQYSVRLPLSLLLGPDKIKLISDNLFSQISINIAGQDYTGSFDYNQSGVATHLKVTGISTINQANTVKAFLNTSTLAFSYKIITQDYAFLSKRRSLILVSLIIGLILVAVLINRLTINNINWKKFLLVAGLTIILFAALKLFAIELTLALILLLVAVLVMGLFNTKSEYYIALLSIIFINKILLFLPGFDISVFAILLVSSFALLIWSTNYVQTKDKKYE